ncbi:MAG: hypothetical protein QGI68_07405 [Pseudomonadales bacterium]|jgi:hypothetical protein|nr:hypothetical protein [Pseudomonadales bacterium]MDP7146049.1 hypothetical protein [Pseudomonadales bacterium]MDP7359499.1 hypothetical protein [Pseudomonadales bacterium]MDP7595383.1 hypothetical protein [Pseudomonadales bacterium]HJN53013.1 hypothetical protein [Pseudomonadales bacterium]|tara:strand:+ start:1452 stop:1745 length:294 start_codon:yes stop_codon:yes gene_type:complete
MAEIHDHASEHSDDVVAAIGPEQEALVAINAYMDAWNQRDLNEMDAAFHFPHARIASGRIHIMEEPTSRSPEFFERFIEQTGWHYSLWDLGRAEHGR